MRTRNLTLIFLCTILTLHLTEANAQNQLEGKTSVWKVIEVVDQVSDSSRIQNSIVLISDTEIGWGPSEAEVEPMNIIATKGHWNIDKMKGSVHYDVLFGDDSGTVEVKGDGQKLEIYLLFTFSNGSADIKLNVESVSFKN